MKTAVDRYELRKNEDSNTQVLSLTKGGIAVKDDLSFGKSAESYIGHQLVKKGQFVFTPRDFDATPILCGVSQHDGCISNLYIVFDVADQIDPRFLQYYFWGLKYGYDFFAKLSFGMRYSFNRTQFEHIPLMHPDKETQATIAAFLDRETALVDRLIEKKYRLVRLLQERVDSALADVVLRPAAPRGLSDHGIAWLGEIPKHWPMSRVGLELRRITYGFTNPMPTEAEGPYLLTANDIADGHIKWETARRTSQRAFDESLTDKSRPQEGDVLVTKDGTLARIAVHDGRPACINQSVALLRPNQARLLPEYLAAVLRTKPYQDRMIFEAGGTTIKHIYISRLAKMPIPLPSLQEQRQIGRAVEQLRNRFLAPRRMITVSIESLRELRGALITAAVTGQIDVLTWTKRRQTQRLLDQLEGTERL